MSMPSFFKYRPEIDGLRALAVIPVVLFHAGLGFPGGFAGVDVFFVISGYLITSLIMKDLRAGTFSMLTFWERRVRRILPASVVVVLVTLIAGAWLLVPEDSERLASSVMWQARFASNIYFKWTINYFSGAAEEMPLLHTWSLAVEEQFYAVTPFVLYGLFRFGGATMRARLTWVLALGTSLSFAYSVLKLQSDPSGAFYLLPSRAWEMLLGAWIAVAPRPGFSRSSALGRGLTFTGISGILIAYFAYEKTTEFPGFAALLPCLGSALYIWASSNGDAQPEQRRLDVAHWLSRSEVVFIGLISYSLYLWHWPLIALSNYWMLFEQISWLRVGVPLVSFLLAYLSWRYVETPFREKRVLQGRTGMLVAGGIAVAIVFIAGIALKKSGGFAWRLDGPLTNLIAEQQDRKERGSNTRELGLADVKAGRFLRFDAPTRSSRRLFVWGDSHARAALSGIVTAAAKHQITVLAAWHGATPPVINYFSDTSWSLGKDAPEFNKAVLDYIAQNKFEDVVLIAYWKSYLRSDPASLATNEHFASELAKVIEHLSSVGCRVWVLLDWPSHRINIPRLVFGQKYLGLDSTSFVSDHSEHEQKTRAMTSLVPRLERAGARILDPAPVFLAPNTSHYRVEANGYPLYYDDNHLSVLGAAHLAGLFEQLFD